jgi:hypothetical protein
MRVVYFFDLLTDKPRTSEFTGAALASGPVVAA